MRLNTTTYPAYIALQNQDAFNLGIDEGMMYDNNFDSIKATVESAISCFNGIPNNKRYFITETFYDVIQGSIDKIAQLIKSQVDEKSTKNHLQDTLIMHAKGFAMHRTYVENNQFVLELFVFSKIALVGYGKSVNTKEGVVNTGNLYTSNPDENPKMLFNMFHNSWIFTVFFLNNCEIETVVLKPREKNRLHGVRYYNEMSKTPITVVDCTWYRELILNIPFGVRGHLRWQPCGEGRNKRKLIWIDGFEKKGYHRKAKKETQQTED